MNGMLTLLGSMQGSMRTFGSNPAPKRDKLRKWIFSQGDALFSLRDVMVGTGAGETAAQTMLTDYLKSGHLRIALKRGRMVFYEVVHIPE